MASKLTLYLTAGWQCITAIPKRYSIPALSLALLTGIYIVCFVLKAPIMFAYAGDNCISQLTFLPNTQQLTSNSPFKISYQQSFRLFNTYLASGKTCFMLQDLVNPGHHTVQSGPFGNWVLSRSYLVYMPDPPQISISSLARPVSLSKPLKLELSAPDETFAYAIQANQEQVDCRVVVRNISCNLSDLALVQGQEYEFAVARYFKNQLIQTIVTPKTKTLTPVTVTETSIQPDEVVVSKPTEISIKFDKPLTTTRATMTRLSSQESEPIQTSIQIVEQELKLSFGELPRQTEFEVLVDQLEARDGSSLIEPYRLRFKTSGGPKVTNISIPQSGVDLDASVIISFDQELMADQNLADQITVSVGQATVVQNGNTAVVALHGIDKCTNFTITVGDAIASIYGISGSSGWSYASRTLCRNTETIGYSVQGRPINAHIYGDGGTNILFIGAMHGNELSSKYLMEAWMAELEANSQSIPADRRVIVIPSANPDGVVANTRNNANNVDLNRNYDMSNWQASVPSPYGGTVTNGGGTSPMSEPETKALANYTIKLNPRLTLSYHSIGGLVMGNGAKDSAVLSKAYSQLTGYGDVTGQVDATFSYKITGAYEDWQAEKLNQANLVIELGSHTNAQFSINKAAMWEMVKR